MKKKAITEMKNRERIEGPSMAFVQYSAKYDRVVANTMKKREDFVPLAREEDATENHVLQ